MNTTPFKKLCYTIRKLNKCSVEDHHFKTGKTASPIKAGYSVQRLWINGLSCYVGQYIY